MVISLHDILNQFPPRQRNGLLQWLIGSKTADGRNACHSAYRKARLDAFKIARPTPRQMVKLSRRSKIAFTVMREFGTYKLHPESYPALIQAVESHLNKLQD